LPTIPPVASSAELVARVFDTNSTLIRAVAALSLFLLGFSAKAQTPADWPCRQRYVPGLSEGAVWTGPALNEASRNWTGDPELTALVEKVASRTTPVAAAVAAIHDYAAKLPDKDRLAKLPRLFSGVFATIDAERNQIINGIRRYSRRQGSLAKRIEERSSELSRLPVSGDPAIAAHASELEQQLYWDSRIFDDRKRMLPYICDQPVVLEQRLFTLTQEILADMPATATLPTQP
jgi:hypothetical protein